MIGLRRFLIFSFLLFSLQGTTTADKTQTGVLQTLIALLEKQDKTNITAEDYESTSLGDLIKLGTPAGYRLKQRYLSFGMGLVEALRAARDPELQRRLIEVVQWSRKPQVRAEAILTLASFGNPQHKRYFKEAILDSKVSIRFAAVEALQRWDQPEDAIPLLRLSYDRDWSPLMQMISAQALLSLGEKEAINILWKGLKHQSWVVRAMAARYLGDYAEPSDYIKINSYFNREKDNDFVLAELAIAALKLISKKGDKVSFTPTRPGWRANAEVAYFVGKDDVVELEPLVIVPPRLFIPTSLRVAARINTELLRLLKDRLNEPLDPEQAQDPILTELNSLVTTSGFGLKTRYSELSYLMVEALAGSSDLLIRAELNNLAQSSTNPLIRATSLISLAYNRNKDDLYLIEDALEDKNVIVRFGAMEAIEIGQFREALPLVQSILNDDPSEALKIYAMQLLAKFGDTSGRNLLIANIGNRDWPARALSFLYLSRYGDPSDYTLVLSRLGTEENPFVQCEIILSVLRLEPL